MENIRAQADGYIEPERHEFNTIFVMKLFDFRSLWFAHLCSRNNNNIYHI